MISNNLAKQLKDAGFPFRKERGVITDHAETYEVFPTLSELIEACGDRFDTLMKGRTSWSAESPLEDDAGTYTRKMEEGSTPEEAVCRLWLALNKK